MMSDLLTLENTAIVLDSTCDAPEGFLDRPGLFMVPLKVHFGDEMFRDGVDMTYKEFFARLEAVPDPADDLPADGRRVRRRLRRGPGAVRARLLPAPLRRDERHGARRRAGRGAVRERVCLRHAHGHHRPVDVRRAPARAARARLHARRGARLRAALPRRLAACWSTPRPSSTCVAAGASGAPPRSSAASSTSSRSSPASTARWSGYAKVRGLKKAMAAMERFVEENSEPDDELYFCLIDAVNEEEPPLIREMIERVRPNAHYVFQGHVRRSRRHAHRPRHGRIRDDRGVTGQPLPLRFGGGRYDERPPVTRLSFDPASLARPLAELEHVTPAGRAQAGRLRPRDGGRPHRALPAPVRGLPRPQAHPRPQGRGGGHGPRRGGARDGRPHGPPPGRHRPRARARRHRRRRGGVVQPAVPRQGPRTRACGSASAGPSGRRAAASRSSSRATRSSARRTARGSTPRASCRCTPRASRSPRGCCAACVHDVRSGDAPAAGPAAGRLLARERPAGPRRRGPGRAPAARRSPRPGRRASASCSRSCS